jgi:Flp pilus assembly protein TadG
MLKKVRFLRDEDGSILLEFALVLPILLLIVFGIMQLSLVYNARMVTAYATYVGARESAVGGDAYDVRHLAQVIMSSLDLRAVVPGVSAYILDTEVNTRNANVEVKVKYRVPIRIPMMERIFDFWGSWLGVPSKEVSCLYELRREGK